MPEFAGSGPTRMRSNSTFPSRLNDWKRIRRLSKIEAKWPCGVGPSSTAWSNPIIRWMSNRIVLSRECQAGKPL